MLTACGGGGSVGGGTGGSLPPPSNVNPSIVDPLTDGATAGQTLNTGSALTAGPNNGTRLVYDAATNRTTRKPANASIQKNVLGGYDVNLNGKQSSFGYSDQKQSKDAWEKILRDPQGNPVYSLTLWNAGKGAREGVVTNENGQTFHKIIGYYVFDNTGTTATRERGHLIIGNPTDLLRMDTKSKKATYDGYFYSNIMPTTGTPPDQALAASGGMRFVADFDTNRISGQSTTFNVREAGAPNFYAANYTVWMQDTAINGNSFAGTMASNYIWLNGDYSGQFYGGNAQELAGVTSGVAGSGTNEGFFTAVALPTVTP